MWRGTARNLTPAARFIEIGNPNFMLCRCFAFEIVCACSDNGQRRHMRRNFVSLRRLDQIARLRPLPVLSPNLTVFFVHTFWFLFFLTYFSCSSIFCCFFFAFVFVMKNERDQCEFIENLIRFHLNVSILQPAASIEILNRPLHMMSFRKIRRKVTARGGDKDIDCGTRDYSTYQW